jgi:hypothetical protein
MKLQTIKQLRLQKLIKKIYLKMVEELSLNKGGSFGLFLKKRRKV